jgi:hypothetical protein
VAKAQSFDDLTTTTLKCRSLTHPWDPIRTVIKTVDRKKAYVVTLVCLRCDSTAQDIVFVATGEKLPRRYHHVDGYLIADAKSWGKRKVFNSNVRLELYGRLVKNGNGRKK